MSDVIVFENVNFRYEQNIEVLKDITFAIEKGESIGLVGANGVGKSTMMKLLLGLETANEGNIFVDGIEVNKKSLREIRQKVGFVLQNSDNQLFMHTVYEDICFGPKNYGFSSEEIEKRANDAMEKTGCAYIKDKQVYKLSGGEKKLASIATILAMNPEVVVMDEPESSLDPMNRKRLIEIVNALDNTKIIASHDLDFIWDTTDKVLLLGEGQIKAFSDTKDILQNEELLTKYNLVVPNKAIIEKLKNA